MRTITCFGDRKLRMCCHPRWPALEVMGGSYINSSVMHSPRFIPKSVFYTQVRVLYPSPYFISSP